MVEKAKARCPRCGRTVAVFYNRFGRHVAPGSGGRFCDGDQLQVLPSMDDLLVDENTDQ